MLYTYREVQHSVYNLHANICYFFEHLFALEPNPYDEARLVNADFLLLINSSDKFKNYFKSIAEKYITLSEAEKEVIKRAYQNHSNIENLCNNTAISAIKYTDIVNEDFRKLLKEFLTWLWDDYSSLPQALRDEYGSIQDHFNEFKKQQIGKVCPFCGITALKPVTDRNRRNAYDHYVPKATYPFVSINFKNLFPLCTDCNSDEKKSYDTPYRNGIRQRVLFPYDTTYSFDNITIYINPEEAFDNVTLSTLLSDIDWNIEFNLFEGSIDIFETWNDIFKIKKRYKETIAEFEDIWFTDFVVKKYNDNVVSGLKSFNNYKDELINDSKSLMIKDPLAILKYIYFNFIFSIPDIEEKLQRVIAI